MPFRRINVAFRFDDPSAKSDWALEEIILREFRGRRMPLTVAVVPVAGFAEPKVSLRERTPPHLLSGFREGWLEIAQHGLTHAVRTTDADGKPSEFRGLPVDDQANLVREGLDVLHDVFGTQVSGFVPPFNSFDGATVTAVSRAGLRYLSGGSDCVATSAELAIVPQTASVVGVTSAVERARRVPIFERSIVAVLHHYDFAESGSDRHRTDLAALARLLVWLSEQPDVSIVTMAQLVHRASVRSWFNAGRLLRMRDRLPRPLRSLIPAELLLHPGSGAGGGEVQDRNIKRISYF